jgi:hypothetical protein
MSVEDLLDLANLHPDILNGESLMKIFTFFTYVPQFKNDILVVQDSMWPRNDPPRYLPKSVTMLLANLCETTDDGVDRLWLLLREAVWVFDGRIKEMETRFQAYGKSLSYRESTRNYCKIIEIECDRCNISSNTLLHKSKLRAYKKRSSDPEI